MSHNVHLQHITPHISGSLAAHVSSSLTSSTCNTPPRTPSNRTTGSNTPGTPKSLELRYTYSASSEISNSSSQSFASTNSGNKWYQRFARRVREAFAKLLSKQQPLITPRPNDAVPALNHAYKLQELNDTIAGLPELLYVLTVAELPADFSYETTNSRAELIKCKLTSNTTGNEVETVIRAKKIKAINLNDTSSTSLWITSNNTILHLRPANHSNSGYVHCYTGKRVFAHSKLSMHKGGGIAQFITHAKKTVSREFAAYEASTSNQPQSQDSATAKFADKFMSLGKFAAQYGKNAEAATLFQAAALIYSLLGNKTRQKEAQLLAEQDSITSEKQPNHRRITAATKIQKVWRRHLKHVNEKFENNDSSSDAVVVTHESATGTTKWAISPQKSALKLPTDTDKNNVMRNGERGTTKQLALRSGETVVLKLNNNVLEEVPAHHSKTTVNAALSRFITPRELEAIVSSRNSAATNNQNTSNIALGYYLKEENVIVSRDAGENLAIFVHKGGRISEEELYSLASCIDQLHSNGIFHRDIKPANICIKPVFKLRFALNSNERPQGTEVLITPDAKYIMFIDTSGKSCKMQLTTLGFNLSTIHDQHNPAAIIRAVQHHLENLYHPSAANHLPVPDERALTFIDFDFASFQNRVSGARGTTGYATKSLQDIMKDENNSPEFRNRAAQVSDYFAFLMTAMLVSADPASSNDTLLAFARLTDYITGLKTSTAANSSQCKEEGIQTLVSMQQQLLGLTKTTQDQNALKIAYETLNNIEQLTQAINVFLETLTPEYRQFVKDILWNPGAIAHSETILPPLNEIFLPNRSTIWPSSA